MLTMKIKTWLHKLKLLNRLNKRTYNHSYANNLKSLDTLQGKKRQLIQLVSKRNREAKTNYWINKGSELVGYKLLTRKHHNLEEM